MFGYIEENATPHSGRTDRADVNKPGALFGGREVWLNLPLTSAAPTG